MSGHLCLKWNNHAIAFLNSISNIQVKERFCDATIVCQGKYFPVHRIILSTCSEYFDEIFERMQCQHPYIVFKDIDPREMELLLNYMYQGEVNVVQEELPVLIKAAEALKIKGLAVPGEVPSGEDCAGKKRSNSDNNDVDAKESESKKRKRSGSINGSDNEAEDLFDGDMDSAINPSKHVEVLQMDDSQQLQSVKEEPLDPCKYENGTTATPGPLPTPPHESQLTVKENNEFGESFSNFSIPAESSNYIKVERGLSPNQQFVEQCSSWSDFGSANIWQNLSSADMSAGNEMAEMNLRTLTAGPHRKLHNESDFSNDEKDGVKRITISKKVYTRTHQKCPYCEYSSYWSTNVKEHIMFKHTGERPIQCSFCTKRFIAKKYLQIHMRTHTGEKPFECQNCGKQFSQKGNLATHMGRKHQCVKQTL